MLRTALLASLLLAVFVATAFLLLPLWLRHAMRSSLPQIDGSLHAPGLSAPVTVVRDQHGIPHIRAATTDDLVFAQGYVTAQDRMWQMDMLRRSASGELAEILGPRLVEHDRAQRYLQMRNTADNAAAHLPADQLHWLEQYARGVNAFLDANADHLPAEFRLLHYRPQPWQVRDSLLVGLYMTQDLTTEFPIKLAREAISAKLTPEMVADLYPVGSWRDHPPGQSMKDLTSPQQEIEQIPLDESQSLLHTPRHTPTTAAPNRKTASPDATHSELASRDTANPQLASRDLADLRTALSVGDSLIGCAGCFAGSNNWVVGGAFTASGKPLLSNDMHLALTVPGIWYMAELHAGADQGGFHATGFTLPGLPFVIAGHNDRIAWGFTNLGADVQDIYVERTDSQGRYADANGAWRPLQHVQETIRVRGGRNVHLDVLLTGHGPILTPLLPHEKRQLSLQWIIYRPSTVTDPYFTVDSAGDWTEFCGAFAGYGGPSQNVVYADVDGNIGYHAVGMIPFRTNGLSGTPIADNKHEWTGYIPFDQLPQIYNPPIPLLATANARTPSDSYPYPITLDWGSPYRNERIWKVLERAQHLEPKDMLALQTDVHSDVDQEVGQRFAYAIDHAQKTSPRLKQAADLLRDWNGEVSKSSPAAAIVDSATKALWPLLLRPHVGDLWQSYSWGESAFAEEELIAHTPERWLPQTYTASNRTWDDLLAEAVSDGLRDAHAPRDLSKWTYGATHTVNLEHPIYSRIPLLGNLLGVRIGTGDLPQDGDASTVKQTGYNFGPSERFTADLGTLNASTLNIVMGQSGNPLSPWFSDQWNDWYSGSTFAPPYGETIGDSGTSHTLNLLP